MATTTQETRPQQAVEHAVDQAKGEARALADEAKRSTAHLGRDARQQLRAQADEQAARVAGSLHQLAGQLGQMGDAGGQGMATDLARDASSRLESLATRLDREGLDSVLAGTKRFARNRPGTFLLLAAAAGAATARLLKATDTERLKEAVQGDTSEGDIDLTTPSPSSSSAPTAAPTAAPAGLTSAPTGEWVGP